MELVSVIVTTRNEEKNIARCLNSIRAQSYPSDKIEIIVVDNGSRDRTKEIVGSYSCSLYNYGPERSAQRNFGASKAAGDFLLFLDADMALSDTLISECVLKCKSENLASLYIPERISGKGFWIKVRDFERSFYNATVIDCVRFVSMGAFKFIGGFDESLTGPEDWDFDRRIKEAGMKSIVNSPIYHNEEGFSLVRYISKKMYYSDSFKNYVKKWGAGDKTVRKQLGFLYRYLIVYFEDGKWKKVLLHPILTMGMYFLRLSLGFSLIFRRGV